MKKSIIEKIVIGVFLLGLICHYVIIPSDDIYRHLQMFDSLNIFSSYKDYYIFYKMYYGNFIFYIFMLWVKKNGFSFIVVQILITYLYYGISMLFLDSIRIRNEEKLFLLLILLVVVNPFYVITILHYPLAASFFLVAVLCNYKKKKILEFIFLLLSYYTHTGILYIIIMYFFSKIKLLRKVYMSTKFFLIIPIVFVVKHKYLILIVDFFNTIFKNNVYMRNKINAYFLSISGKSFSFGGVGTVTLVMILYFLINCLVLTLLTRNIKNDMVYLFRIFIIGVLILGVFNTIFIVRANYILVALYPLVYSLLPSEQKKIVLKLLVLVLVFVVEYRFILNLRY